MEKISEIMKEDHKRILKLLDNSKNEKEFRKFRWALEKHIFLEEKAIFIIYSPENAIQSQMFEGMLSLYRGLRDKKTNTKEYSQ